MASMKNETLPVTDPLKSQETQQKGSPMTKKGVYAAISYMASAGDVWAHKPTLKDQFSLDEPNSWSSNKSSIRFLKNPSDKSEKSDSQFHSKMEGLNVSDTNLVVYVHPSKSNKVDQAIRRELGSLLFKFSEIFDGVVLAYEFKSEDKTARILPGIHPYFGVKVKAKLLLFSPKPNMLIEGKVVKLTQDSIHVIVLGFSSAIITDENIREEFKYKIKHGEEVFASRYHKRHVIKVGTMIRFLVKSMDEEILHISGSLIPAHTGSIRWLDKNSEDVSLTDRSTKKRREGEGETETQDHGTVGGEAFSMSNDHQIKKSKKRKIADNN